MMTLPIFFAQNYSETETVAGLATGYTILTIAIPIMIALILLLLFIMAIGIIGVQDKIREIRWLLEDIFSEKLETIELAREHADIRERMEKQNLRKELAPERRARMITLLIALGIVTLLVLVALLIFAAVMNSH